MTRRGEWTLADYRSFTIEQLYQDLLTIMSPSPSSMAVTVSSLSKQPKMTLLPPLIHLIAEYVPQLMMVMDDKMSYLHLFNHSGKSPIITPQGKRDWSSIGSWCSPIRFSSPPPPNFQMVKQPFLRRRSQSNAIGDNGNGVDNDHKLSNNNNHDDTIVMINGASASLLSMPLKSKNYNSGEYGHTGIA
jgi:hypothetical protein